MKYSTAPMALIPVVLFLSASPALVASAENTVETAAEVETTAKQAELQPQLESEYQHALSEAEASRQAAKASLEKVREKLHEAHERRQEEKSRRAALSNEQAKELSRMHEELNNAHRQLRESSREIARVNRELARVRMSGEAPGVVSDSVERPVLGIILGDAEKMGVRILGVSPDGPAERAGVKAGDVIVALGARQLTAGDEGSVRDVLRAALHEIKADEPVNVSVERNGEILDMPVVPEVREPLTWQSIVHLSTAPGAPPIAPEAIRIERIKVPHIDGEALREKIEQIRVEIDERRALMDSGLLTPSEHEYEFRFDSDELSELGDLALQDANVWFGMPLAAGLRLASIDPELGRYFKTERGVLVLKAKKDNSLQLRSGDVVLSVGQSDVNSPGDLMRALREFEPGEEMKLAIKRERKSKTLKVAMPEHSAQLIVPDGETIHDITITTDE